MRLKIKIIRRLHVASILLLIALKMLFITRLAFRCAEFYGTYATRSLECKYDSDNFGGRRLELSFQSKVIIDKYFSGLILYFTTNPYPIGEIGSECREIIFFTADKVIHKKDV